MGPDHGKTVDQCYAKYIEYKIPFSNGSGLSLPTCPFLRCPDHTSFHWPYRAIIVKYTQNLDMTGLQITRASLCSARM